jgi:hypothetical protein
LKDNANYFFKENQMIKKCALLLPILFATPLAMAEINPYINADIGYADTDFDNGFYFDVGGGIKFNDNIEFEVAYNDYGEIGPYGVEITSYSYGINLGGKVSDSTRLFAILGAERLEADDSVRFGPININVDESSTEAYFGIGAAFSQSENVDIRTKLISHDSADLITLSVGFALYF